MAHERLVPENVYNQLPRGPTVEDTYSQVVVATGTRQVHIAGTVSVNEDGELVGRDDFRAQVVQIMENIGKSLEAASATPSDVVRVTIHTVDMDRYLDEGAPEAVDFFDQDELPASAIFEVSRLADPEYLVEIETTAVVE